MSMYLVSNHAKILHAETDPEVISQKIHVPVLLGRDKPEQVGARYQGVVD